MGASGSATRDAYGKTGSSGSTCDPDEKENSAPAASSLFQPGDVVLAKCKTPQWWPAIIRDTCQARISDIDITSCKVGYPITFFYPKNLEERRTFCEEINVKPFEDLPLEDVKHERYFEKLKASFQLAKWLLEIPLRERYEWWMIREQTLQNDVYVGRSHRQQHRSSRAKKTPEVGAFVRGHPSKSSGTRKSLEDITSNPIKLNDGHKTKKIVLVSESHPEDQLTATDTKDIHMTMDHLIDQMLPGDFRPLILKSKFDCGALLIECADEFSEKWVIGFFNSKEWCGKKIRAVPTHSVLPDTVVIALETQDIFTVDPLRLFRRLSLLNPGLNTTKWKKRDWFRYRMVDEMARWIIEIDAASARTIKKKNMELFVGSFGKGSVEILDGEALFNRGTPLSPMSTFREAQSMRLLHHLRLLKAKQRKDAAKSRNPATLNGTLNQTKQSSQLTGGSGASGPRNTIKVLPSPMLTSPREAQPMSQGLPIVYTQKRVSATEAQAKAPNPSSATVDEAQDESSVDNSFFNFGGMNIASLSSEAQDESSVDNSSFNFGGMNIASLFVVDKDMESALLAGEQ